MEVPVDQERIARFWRYVDIKGPDECWPWTGAVDKNGYGRTAWYTRPHYSHRLAYFLTTGTWPMPMGRHTCDNPPCC